MGLNCASCGYDNDPTRVYCHNCGTKLERGEGDPAPPSVFSSSPPQVKIKKRREPIAWGRYFLFFLRLCVLVGLVTAIVLALIPPRSIPAPVTPDEDLARRLSGLVQDAALADGKRGFAISAADLQRWFSTVVQFRRPENLWEVDPQRVYIEQKDGSIRVGVEALAGGAVNLYFEGEYAPVPTAGGGYGLKPLGYSIGRLPIPAEPQWIGWLVERQMSALGGALAEQLSHFSKASQVQVTPREVVLTWGGANNNAQ